jgi:hypothetical protein
VIRIRPAQEGLPATTYQIGRSNSGAPSIPPEHFGTDNISNMDVNVDHKHHWQSSVNTAMHLTT